MLKKLLKTTIWLLIAVVTLTWYTCNPPDLGVEQPEIAEKYSSFEATVWVTGHGNNENREVTEIMSKIGVELPQELLTQGLPGNDRDENWLYFGIKLPQGWEVTDSIPFLGVDTGIFVYSDSLSAEMDTIEPPEPGFYWWVSETPEPINTSYGTIEYFPEISTDGQSGNFYIDYMLGYNSRLNKRRNNDHYIGVGLADTAWVTSSAESGPGSIRAAIDSVWPGGHVCFAVPLPVTILLTEQIVIYKDINIHGPGNMQLFFSGGDSCRIFHINNNIEADISSLQIVNGNAGNDNGGGIYCGEGTSVNFTNLKIQHNQAASGGGIYFSNNEVYMENVNICSNTANVDGGGIYFNNNEAGMEDVTINSNTANGNGGGIYIASGGNIQFDSINRCDIYQNSANLGFDLYNAGEQVVDVIVDKFTVAWPNDYFAFPYDKFTFDMLNHVMEQYQQDLYVSPDGSDTNSGVTPAQPKKTIANALAWIVGTEDDPNTIHLAPGLYAKSVTGEKFPLYCRSYVSISGSATDSVILSGENQYRVFEIINSGQMMLEDMIIQDANYSGIYCRNSSPVVSNITIRGCAYDHAILFIDCQDVILTDIKSYDNDYDGIHLSNSTATISHADIHNNNGGITLSQSEALIQDCNIYHNSNGGLGLRQQSVANVNNCRLWGNSASLGGGIRCYEGSNIELSACQLKENSATEMGGGIYLESSSLTFNDSLRSDIYLNEAPAGSDLYSVSSPVTNVVVDTFTVLYPNNYFAFPMPAFTFDILNFKQPQYDQDLFVSPSGSDENTGLTPEDPLLSITRAMKTICTPGGPHTIHLAPGTYPASQTGEQFPIICQDSVSICGVPDSITILGGIDNSRIMHAETVSGFTVSNLNIYNGMALYGGGIYAVDAEFILEDVLVHYNRATWGSGIYMESSDIEMQGVSIENNNYIDNASCGGGLFITGDCRLITDSLSISYNRSKNGAGIYLENAAITLQNIVLSNNITIPTNSTDKGGGIFCTQSEVVFKNLFLEANRSATGGGMACVDCDPFLENVKFQDNYASSSGGGLWLEVSSPFLYDVEFINNKSSGNGKGGGIHLQQDSDALLIDVDFRNNGAGDGGGMYSDMSQPVLIQCSFFQNKSDNGGGLYINNHSNPYIFNSAICANVAKSGGGIFNTNFSDPYLSESIITDNESLYGGGIYFMDSATVTFDPDNRCNIFFNDAYHEGADLYADGCGIIPVIVDTFTVLHPTDFFAHLADNFEFDILNYKLEQGEFDMYVSPEGSDNNTGTSPEDPLLTIHTAISRIMTDSVPPFIIHLAPGTYSESATGEIYPLNCRTNVWLLGEDSASTILDGNGARILDIIGSEGFVISDVTLRNGWNNNKGGGVYCEDANIFFERVGITACYASRGGGLYIAGMSDVRLQDVHIFNNTARYGAGLYCIGESVITGNNILISGNSVINFGGGVCCSNFNGKLINLTIRNNEAVNGGGICCSRSSPPIYNTVISGNTAVAKGGAIYLQAYSYPELTNLSISGNTATVGGAVYGYTASSMELTNCIFRDNNEQGIYLDNCGLVVSYSDIEGGLDSITLEGDSWVDWLEGNIDEDPLFSNTGEHPLSLTGGSPCINTGTPDTTGLNLPLWDIIGNMRVWDGVIDMGAYEYGSMPVGIDRLQVAVSGLQVLVYPNPAGRMMNIEYVSVRSEAKAGRIQNVEMVNLSVFDIHGKKIATLVNETQAAGEYTVRFDGSDLPSGIYLIRLQAGNEVVTKKIIKL